MGTLSVGTETLSYSHFRRTRLGHNILRSARIPVFSSFTLTHGGAGGMSESRCLQRRLTSPPRIERRLRAALAKLPPIDQDLLDARSLRPSVEQALLDPHFVRLGIAQALLKPREVCPSIEQVLFGPRLLRSPARQVLRKPWRLRLAMKQRLRRLRAFDYPQIWRQQSRVDGPSGHRGSRSHAGSDLWVISRPAGAN